MTAAEIWRKAVDAGLVITLVGTRLEVRGPDDARVEFLPMLAAAGKSIAKLIAEGTMPAPVPACVGYSARACIPCGIVHGRLAPDPCSGCGAEDWVVVVGAPDGTKLCATCWAAS